MNNKIALICSNLKVGGTQNVVVNASNILAKMNYNITVITFSDEDKDFYNLSDNVSRISLGIIKNSNNFFESIYNNVFRIIKLRSIIKKEKIDTCVSFITDTNVITAIALIFLKKRVILSERNNPYISNEKIVWKLLKTITYPLAKIITANSEKGVAFYTNKRFIKKIAYLPNPLPEPQPDFNRTSQNFLSVGKLHKQKGHDILLQAFAKFLKLRESYSSITLTIAGEGKDETKLKKLTKELGIEKNVTWLKNQNIYLLLKNHSFFVLASRYEGTSNAVIEAISMSTISILSDEASSSIEFLQNNHNCIIFPSEDINSLCLSMQKLIEDSELRLQLGNNLKDDYNNYYANLKIDEYWQRIIDS